MLFSEQSESCVALALRNTIPGPASFRINAQHVREIDERLSPKIQSLSVDDSLPRIYIRTLLDLNPSQKKTNNSCATFSVGQLGGVISFSCDGQNL